MQKGGAALRLQIAVEPIKVASADLFMPGTEDIVSDKLRVTSDKPGISPPFPARVAHG